MDTCSCLSCNYKDDLKTCLNEYDYCTNCFHIQKKKFETSNKNKFEYNKKTFLDHILPYINKISNSDKINVLVINDMDTQLLDEITEMLSLKMNKYNINTVSVSTFYNASYFSRHNHYKFQLTDYISQILYDKYGVFDLIILNDTLTYCENIQDILMACKRLSGNDTTILSINLHTSILFSVNVFSMDKNVNHIFNINSMKTLCTNSNLQLNDIIYDNCWMISVINGCINKSNITTKIIADKLYDEMSNNLYDEDSYSKLSEFLDIYVNNINEILQRYKSIGYNIVIINNLDETETYININHTMYIKTKNVKNGLQNLKKDDIVIVIFDYTNIENIKRIIKTFSEQTNSKWLFFDLENLIGYHYNKLIV